MGPTLFWRLRRTIPLSHSYIIPFPFPPTNTQTQHHRWALILLVSAATLLSQALITTSSPKPLLFISSHIRTLFQAADFPASSPLFSLLNLMLSQTIFSLFFALPFTLTFLILAKASVIQTTVEFPGHRQSPPPFSSLLQHYCPLLLTHLFNSFIILFNAADFLGLSSSFSLLAISSSGAVLYSVSIANTVVGDMQFGNRGVSNRKCGGYLPILKACVLIRGRVVTSLSLALSTNLAMVAVEALCQYRDRVMRPYHISAKLNPSIVWEGLTIAYIHSIMMVLEIIVSCFFYKDCKSGCRENQVELEPEDKCEV